MKSDELKRHLAKQGCTFETHKGGSGHITVRRGTRVTQLPMHGSHKELLKDLGLKGTSKNCHRSSGAPNLPANDSALFSFRFCAVHQKDARVCQLQQFFEVP